MLGERGRWLCDRSRLIEGTGDLKRSVRLNPNLQHGYWVPLADVLSRSGDDSLSRAIELYNQGQLATNIKEERGSYLAAIDACPEFPWSWNNLAWSLATCKDVSLRDGERAVLYARRVCLDEGWDYHGMWDTLAAAHAEMKAFDEAMLYCQKAILACPGSDASEYEENLIRFRSLTGHVENNESKLTLKLAIEHDEFNFDEAIVFEFSEMEDAAASFVSRTGNDRFLFLDVKELSPTSSEALSRCNGWLFLDCIDSMSPDVAVRLGRRCKGSMSLDGLTSLDIEVARGIGQFTGYALSLRGLQSIEPDVVAELSKAKVRYLTLGLTHIDTAMAEALSTYDGYLCLPNLVGLSDQVARQFARNLATSEPIFEHDPDLIAKAVAGLRELPRSAREVVLADWRQSEEG